MNLCFAALLLPCSARRVLPSTRTSLCAAGDSANEAEQLKQRKIRQSLPTKRERWGFHRAGVRRESAKVSGRSISCTGFHSKCWDLEYVENEQYPLRPPLSCVYWVHLMASKALLGKKAVFRTTAKRKVREALRRVLPEHATRGKEYIFFIQPEARIMKHTELLEDAERTLRDMHCWNDSMPAEAHDRPFLSLHNIQTKICNRRRRVPQGRSEKQKSGSK
eukprot:Plantae.Rhodophyta-Purpureofilum_apyrenoidigerum.ctg33277.p1 GENE.Plantae.Rhodophyta-Purpureofilum_apyrenoidigerum.ctg33277~~Plantae.Rhodophyta-Purpureofilum_apyrenoidigerum.ctg33277.p1  ORF type:complete len:220 (+),score=24.49 Plantae.Rhodophyta-Purpureofilum_apyrenoidigerum.ctg33277:477-1136(+)